MLLIGALSFVAALLLSVSAGCMHSISCPCGSSKKNFTFCVSAVNSKENPCERWSHCETCVDFMPDCLSCPSGRSGSVCSEVIGREIIRKKRQSRGSVVECGITTVDGAKSFNHRLDAAPGEWPWMVHITVAKHYKDPYSLMDRHENVTLCAGVLLNQRTILTAADCFNEREEYKDSFLLFGKVGGIAHHPSDEEEGAQIRRTSLVIIHRDFNKKTHENDIALIRFQPNVRYTSRVRPICLPTRHSWSNVYPDGTGYVTGWDYMVYFVHDNLRMTTMNVQPNDNCTTEITSGGVKDFNMHPGMFCTKSNGAGICFIQSASPFVIQDPYTRSYTVEGIYSHAIPEACDFTGVKPVPVFTKLVRYSSWIRINMRRTYWKPIEDLRMVRE